MKFQDIANNTPKYYKGAFGVVSIGEATPSEHGQYQDIVLEDEDGKQESVRYYFTEGADELQVGDDWVSSESTFNIRFKDDYWQGNPLHKGKACDVKVDSVALGKCRYGLLQAEIRKSGVESIDIVTLECVSRCAQFCMDGEI